MTFLSVGIYVVGIIRVGIIRVGSIWSGNVCRMARAGCTPASTRNESGTKL